MTEEVTETGFSATSSSDHRLSYLTGEHLNVRTVRSPGHTYIYIYIYIHIYIYIYGVRFLAIFLKVFPDRLPLHVRQFAVADDVTLEFSVRKPDFLYPPKIVVRSPDFAAGQGVGSLLPIH